MKVFEKKSPLSIILLTAMAVITVSSCGKMDSRTIAKRSCDKSYTRYSDRKACLKGYMWSKDVEIGWQKAVGDLCLKEYRVNKFELNDARDLDEAFDILDKKVVGEYSACIKGAIGYDLYKKERLKYIALARKHGPKCLSPGYRNTYEKKVICSYYLKYWKQYDKRNHYRRNTYPGINEVAKFLDLSKDYKKEYFKYIKQHVFNGKD